SRFQTLIAFLYLSLGKIEKIKQLKLLKCKAASICPESQNYTIQAEGELYDLKDAPRLDARLICGELQFYLPKND
ncbi:MAG: hypothetical protein ACI4L9_05730, partial [Candidatus Coproplasma sp.]